MSTPTAARRSFIRSWTAISPLGIGREAFRAGITAGERPALDETDAFATEHGATARVVPSFPVKALLGKKGVRAMDRVTALTVATVGQLVNGGSAAPVEVEPRAAVPDRALVLGTTTGSAQSMMDFTRSTYEGEKPFFVDPARFPNTVMNCAAGRAAIWYQLRGPNATIGGGRVSGLLALNYSRRLHLTRRARTVLCGAAEEFSPAREELHRLASGGEIGPLGEGCALISIGDSGDTETGAADLAEITVPRFGVADGPEAVRGVLADCVRRVLAENPDLASRVWVHAAGSALETEVVTEALGSAPRPLVDDDLIGDTSGAAAMFQIVSVLALAENEPSAEERAALITAVDEETGSVGCALLRLVPAGS